MSFHTPHEPDAVVRAETADEVRAVVALCAKRRVPLTPRGAGTGIEYAKLLFLAHSSLSLAASPCLSLPPLPAGLPRSLSLCASLRPPPRYAKLGALLVDAAAACPMPWQ